MSSHAEDYNRKQLEEAEKKDRIFRETVNALKTQERFVNFFKQYNAKSVESFIKLYANQKASWYQHGDSFHKYKEQKKRQWHNAGVEMLKEIFTKKLFNLKCRWVAGEMDLPNVEISADFDNWQNNPQLYAAVEPITREEMESYLQYFEERSENTPEDDDDYDDERGSAYSALHFFHWYRSGSMDDADCARLIPPWFHRYDELFGTAPLMNLPVIRMDLEQDYNDIYVEHIHKKTLTEEQLKTFTHSSRLQRAEWKANPEKLEAVREENHRKWEEAEKTRPKYFHISVYNREKMQELVSLIEPPEVKELYEVNREWTDRSDKEDELFTELTALKEAKEYIPVQSHDDYREAIREAYKEYKNKMWKEALPPVFDEYCKSLSDNQPFNWDTSPFPDSSPGAARAETVRRILAARKWKGEPENLDFLKKENLPK